MENKDKFSGYSIADITEEDIKNITELEKTISGRTKEDIVLIAYKQSNSEG